MGRHTTTKSSRVKPEVKDSEYILESKEMQTKLNKAISVLAVLSDVPRNQLSEKQLRSLVIARSQVYSHGERVVNLIISKDAGPITFDEDLMGPYEISYSRRAIPKLDDLLNETEAPEVIADSADSLERAMSEIYQKLGRVEYAYSNITPAAEYVEEVIERGRKVVKAMHSGSTEWRGESVAEWWLPENLLALSMIMDRYSRRLKIRYDHLWKSYEIASRLLTVHIESPTGSANYGNRMRLKEERGTKKKAKTKTKTSLTSYRKKT